MKLYTVKETAELLASSQKTVRELIKRGELSAHRFANEYRISDEAISEFLKKTLVNPKNKEPESNTDIKSKKDAEA